MTELTHVEKRFCPSCSRITKQQDGAIVRMFSKRPVWLILMRGKYGAFFGCPNYPKCKYSESIERQRTGQLFGPDEVCDIDFQT